MLITAVALAFKFQVSDISDDGIALSEQTSSGRRQSSILLGELLYDFSAIASAPLTDELQLTLLEYQEVNSSVIGLLDIPDLNIFEPILEARDNKQWLRTNIYGEPDVAGAVFMDWRSNLQLTPVKLIHGHNMSDGTMFGRLPELLFYENCSDMPAIYLHTEQGTATYRVFSVISVDATEEALPVDPLAGVDEIRALQQALFKRSWVPGGNPETLDILTLNTCWYGESGNERNLHCIVSAARVGI